MNIFEMAKEAGFEVWEADYALQGQLERFAALVRAEREWVDLTDAELNNLWIGNTQNGWIGLLRAVTSAFKEKNK